MALSSASEPSHISCLEKVFFNIFQICPLEYMAGSNAGADPVRILSTNVRYRQESTMMS